MLFPALSQTCAIIWTTPFSENPGLNSNISWEIETSFKSSKSPPSISNFSPKSLNVFPSSKLTLT